MQKEISNFLKNYLPLKDFVRELLFPSYCCICGKKTETSFICKSCREKIKYNEFPLIEHNENIYFYAIAQYEGVIEHAVKCFKFKELKALSYDFALMILEFTRNNNIDFDFVSFVPMTRLEVLRRGYNQTQLIAKSISKISGKPIYSGVTKIKNTKKQVGLGKEERVENIKGAFRLKEAPPSGNILLVDDVYTTGSTAFEITKCIGRKLNGKLFFVALSRKIE